MPSGVFAAYTSKRRAFIWSGEDTASGADCLVAWDKVTTPTECGGLGVRDLNIQNRCLLLKLLHKLHTRTESSWASWVAEHADIASMEGDLNGDHWETMRALQPAYQELTTVKLGDGRTCSFWNDSWLPQGRLSDKLPALFSHALKPSSSVRTVITNGLRSHLTPRLSRVAKTELQLATAWLADIQISTTPDQRCSPLIDNDNRLRTAPIYKMLVAGTDHSCPYAHYVWRNRSPPRVQFFSWLMVQGRIKSRSTLLTKHVVQDATCELCRDAAETADHLILHCTVSRAFWAAIGVQLSNNISVQNIWEIARPERVPQNHYHCFLQLCCWMI
ncbi:hypothetical protein PR202_ga04013 [Eleusine coracana subsp. coracana]|uniref:Reverse transcriptase zinc-binding domain-containing protein n=1 Tax=Eleusine coracana subsp. coracana TaxID=191504 RepID=A0AAV5BPV2_ELECO|nr:hypothetical protein PR202_ga04013 [Eleusine coracana subsp. coracana]